MDAPGTGSDTVLRLRVWLDMTHQSDEGAPFRLSPDEAFTLLGNETRVEILQALWEAYDPGGAESGVPFSDLYDRVAIEDTGNFNYHLGQLVDHFVTETDDGYQLAQPGFRIVRAIIAGTATADPTLPATPVDVSCPRCDGAVTVAHEGGTTWAQCTECEGFWDTRSGGIVGFGLPPRGLRDRTAGEILEATITYSLHRAGTLGDGVCPDCGGTVGSSLSVCEDHHAADGVCETCGSYFLGMIVYVCDACKYAFRTPSWHPLQSHPAVVAFYHDHGVDHVHTNSWDGMLRGFEWQEELLSVEPPRLRITVPLAGDELQATLDETGTIVGVER